MDAVADHSIHLLLVPVAGVRHLIRWSKKDENHLALLQLAAGLIAYKKAHPPVLPQPIEISPKCRVA
jgi:hypothetical protein